MTSKEIVCRLIDEDKINGEEAYILLNDILKAEMQEVWKTLEQSKKSLTPIWTDYTTTASGSQITSTSGIALNVGGSGGYSISSV